MDHSTCQCDDKQSVPSVTPDALPWHRETEAEAAEREAWMRKGIAERAAEGSKRYWRKPVKRGGASGGGSAATGDPAVRLESTGNKWKRQVEVVTHRCNARTCKDCGRRRGWETRQVLLEPERLALFKNPVLLTLTIDPKRFASAEEAHDTVTEGGFIRRLLRLMKITTWVWVLEFQKNGWPHWHVLVDLSERGALRQSDLRRAWRLWRDRWGLGGLDVRLRKSFETAEHAVHYATKYLTKPPKAGYPAWFLKGKGRRMIQGSKRVGRLCFKGGGKPEASESEHKKRRKAKTLQERMAECGQYSHLVERWINAETGEQSMRHVGEIPLARAKLLELQRAGRVPVRIKVEGVEVVGLGFTRLKVLLRGSWLDQRVTWLQWWAANVLSGEVVALAGAGDCGVGSEAKAQEKVTESVDG